MMKKRVETIDLDINDGEHIVKNMQSNLMSIYNGKYGGGGVILSPLALVNDGLLEVVTTCAPLNMFGFMKKAEFAKRGAQCFYDDDVRIFRASSIKITNKSVD
jgi:diacylglycerol kinase family enzyme